MNNFSPSHNQNVCSYDHVFELLNPYQTTVIFHTPKKHQKIRSFMEFSGCTGTIGAKWVKESLSLWHAILLCSNFYTFLMLYSDWRTTIKIMLVGCFVSPLSFLFTFFSYFLWLMHIIDIWGKTYINTVLLFAISYWIFCLSLYIVPKIKIEWVLVIMTLYSC